MKKWCLLLVGIVGCGMLCGCMEDEEDPVQILTRQLKAANQELGEKTATLGTLQVECEELAREVKGYYKLQGEYKTLKRQYTTMKASQGDIIKQRKQLLQLKDENALLNQRVGEIESLEAVAQNYQELLKCTKIVPFNTFAGSAVRIADDDVKWFSRAELKAVKKRFGEWSAQLMLAPKFIPLNAEMYLQAGQETQALQSISYEVSEGICELTIPDVDYVMRAVKRSKSKECLFVVQGPKQKCTFSFAELDRDSGVLSSEVTFDLVRLTCGNSSYVRDDNGSWKKR